MKDFLKGLFFVPVCVAAFPVAILILIIVVAIEQALFWKSELIKIIYPNKKL